LKSTNLRRLHPPVSIAIIGKGRLGRSLAVAIRSLGSGYTLFAHLPARADSFAALSRRGGPDVVFIVCADRYVASTAARAITACGIRTRIAIHCAGSLPASVMPAHLGVDRALLHPIQTFPKADANAFDGISFGLQTTDESARRFALSFVKHLGAKQVIQLTEDQLPLYHASTMIAANFITLLAATIESLAPEFDLSPKQFKAALAPLMESALANALGGPALSALTGPIARGDADTIARHRRELRRRGRTDVLRLYDAFLALARELS
jgi:predicted short-subunit dehydrogenase-like oxidoreductase (DUF2520 family)